MKIQKRSGIHSAWLACAFEGACINLREHSLLLKDGPVDKERQQFFERLRSQGFYEEKRV